MEKLVKMAFNDIYRNKTVLITGHTGFKGSWLSTWLNMLGATVWGISKDIPTTPSMFGSLNLEQLINHRIADIRDFETLNNLVHIIQPDVVFHLAGQSIVSESYNNPLETITTNVTGTANVLESLRGLNKRVNTVVITSDKVYDNVEQQHGYAENDAIGGKDIYSGSKGAAELIIRSYWHSFLKNNNNVRLATARAGNVIGGGDWSKNRIVPDCIISWMKDSVVELRHPQSTRPWQHVLEPLSGYLRLGQLLAEENAAINGEAFNLGPATEDHKTVAELVKGLSKVLRIEESQTKTTTHTEFVEAGLLQLNCAKAEEMLAWRSVLDFEQMIGYIATWYDAYYKKFTAGQMQELTKRQIKEYITEAVNKNLAWTTG